MRTKILRACKYCNEMKDARYGICAGCITINTTNQTKLCIRCGVLQGWANFHHQPGKIFNLRSDCKPCRYSYSTARLKKKEPFLRAMLSSCKSRINALRSRGRRELKFTLTYKEMAAKLEKQQDRCAYSDILMSFTQHSDWKCSPERIDNTKGYTDANVIFICQEFQLGGSIQSSRALVHILRTTEHRPHPRLTEIMNGDFNEKKYIPHCSIGCNACTICKAEYDVYYRNTIAGKLKILASGSKALTNRRISRGRNHSPSELDSEFLLQLLQKQQGKCFLSGHHLGFESKTYNCISVERKNVNLSYDTVGNCCLIMICLNTSDRTSQTSILDIPKEGCGGWTSEKIEFLRRSTTS